MQVFACFNSETLSITKLYLEVNYNTDEMRSKVKNNKTSVFLGALFFSLISSTPRSQARGALSDDDLRVGVAQGQARH